MVNLPEDENNIEFPYHPRRTLYQQLGDGKLYVYNEPARLLDLEKLADISAYYLKYVFTNGDPRQVAMNHLRQMFNLEFKLCCDACGTAHHQDEITAPER